MKNLLTLHEAVVVVLLKKTDRKATFEEIASVITKRNLFPERVGGITLADQIKLRTTLKSSKYRHWFKFYPPDIIQLK